MLTRLIVEMRTGIDIVNEELPQRDIEFREVQLNFFCVIDHSIHGLSRIEFELNFIPDLIW